MAERIEVTFCRQCKAEMAVGTAACPNCGFWNGTRDALEVHRANMAKLGERQRAEAERDAARLRADHDRGLEALRNPARVLDPERQDPFLIALWVLTVFGVLLTAIGAATAQADPSAGLWLPIIGGGLLGLAIQGALIRGAILSAGRALERERRP